jgi:hypothetical protein
MLLESIHLSNFFGTHNDDGVMITVDNVTSLALLVGGSGTGKSCIFKAVRFFVENFPSTPNDADVSWASHKVWSRSIETQAYIAITFRLNPEECAAFQTLRFLGLAAFVTSHVLPELSDPSAIAAMLKDLRAVTDTLADFAFLRLSVARSADDVEVASFAPPHFSPTPSFEASPPALHLEESAAIERHKDLLDIAALRATITALDGTPLPFYFWSMALHKRPAALSAEREAARVRLAAVCDAYGLQTGGGGAAAQDASLRFVEKFSLAPHRTIAREVESIFSLALAELRAGTCILPQERGVLSGPAALGSVLTYDRVTARVMGLSTSLSSRGALESLNEGLRSVLGAELVALAHPQSFAMRLALRELTNSGIALFEDDWSGTQFETLAVCPRPCLLIWAIPTPLRPYPPPPRRSSAPSIAAPRRSSSTSPARSSTPPSRRASATGC